MDDLPSSRQIFLEGIIRSKTGRLAISALVGRDKRPTLIYKSMYPTNQKRHYTII